MINAKPPLNKRKSGVVKSKIRIDGTGTMPLIIATPIENKQPDKINNPKGIVFAKSIKGWGIFLSSLLFVSLPMVAGLVCLSKT